MMRLLSIIGWTFLIAWLVVLGWWAHEASTATQTAREAFLRERWELAEQKAALCEKRCAQAHELAERSAEAWERFEAAMGLEARP